MAERHPEWRIRYVELCGFRELFVPSEKLVMIDRSMASREWAEAHVLVHLDVHMDVLLSADRLDGYHCREASAVANLRLGREDLFITAILPS